MRAITIVILAALLSCSSFKANDDTAINSNGIGGIKLCDKISAILEKYPKAETINFEGDEGAVWKGYKIMLPDKKWILVETSWEDSTRISRLTTNSPKFTTINGYRVGDMISKLKENHENISYSESEMGFEVISKGLNFGFAIEPEYTNEFYEKVSNGKVGASYLELIDNKATIQEITIAGSCK